MPLGHVAAEIHAELETVGFDGRETPLHDVVDLLGGESNDRGEPQILEGFDCGKRPVPTRRSQERDVVAEGLVAIASTEVVDTQPASVCPALPGQVIAG